MSTTPIGTGAAFEDSNIAMMGSTEAHDAMKAAAEGDKAWKGAGKAAGVEIWRVENKPGHFGVHRWPKEKYGQFHTGDAYIVLHTKPDVSGGAGFDWDIFFWLGKECSQDERGVAAYKTVELSDLLGGSPTQHRVVNPHESAEFLTLFDGMPTFLAGGIDSGFNHVEPEAYKPRLMWVKGKKAKMKVAQCTANAALCMNEGDVFILDMGLKILQWNGAESSVWERQRAGAEAMKIKDSRGVSAAYTQVEHDSAEFFENLEGTLADVLSADAVEADAVVKVQKLQLYRLSEQGDGTMTFSVIATGKHKMKKELLDPTDVFVLDCGPQVYVWIGSQASKKEKKEVWSYAEKVRRCRSFIVLFASTQQPAHARRRRVAHPVLPLSLGLFSSFFLDAFARVCVWCCALFFFVCALHRSTAPWRERTNAPRSRSFTSTARARRWVLSKLSSTARRRLGRGRSTAQRRRRRWLSSQAAARPSSRVSSLARAAALPPRSKRAAALGALLAWAREWLRRKRRSYSDSNSVGSAACAEEQGV